MHIWILQHYTRICTLTWCRAPHIAWRWCWYRLMVACWPAQPLHASLQQTPFSPFLLPLHKQYLTHEGLAAARLQLMQGDDPQQDWHSHQWGVCWGNRVLGHDTLLGAIVDWLPLGIHHMKPVEIFNTISWVSYHTSYMCWLTTLSGWMSKLHMIFFIS